MALRVNTNQSSMNALMNLNRTSRSLGGAFQRVSSGLRINQAADDAAGMGVEENLSAAVGSSRIAMRNTNDGVSVVQIAEGAATEVINIVKRMRELAVQSASEILNKRERLFIQDEYEQLEREVDRVSQVTDFNGRALGDGSITEIEVQVGKKTLWAQVGMNITIVGAKEWDED